MSNGTPSGQTMQILLIEDNPGDVRLVAEAIRQSKMLHELHVAEDGQEGMAFLRREGAYSAAPEPDIILLDLNLPNLDGREVLAEVKTSSELKRIPVVILTSSDAEADIIKAYDLYCNAYMVKPFTASGFLDVVRAIEWYWLNLVKLPPKNV